MKSDLSFTIDEIEALRSIQKKCYQRAKTSGWHKKKREFGTRIALAHSELSEALEGYRKDLMDDHLPDRPSPEVELADCMIRIFDTAQKEGWDVPGAMAEKHDYNGVREDHKPKNRAKKGGKSF